MSKTSFRHVLIDLGNLVDRWYRVQRESDQFFSALVNSAERLEILIQSPQDVSLLDIFEGAKDAMIHDHLESMESSTRVLWKAMYVI